MIIQKHEVYPTDKKKRWTGKGVDNGKSFCRLDKKKRNDKMAWRCVWRDHEQLELFLSNSNNQPERKK